MSMSKPLSTRIPAALATFLLLVAPLAALVVVPSVGAQPPDNAIIATGPADPAPGASLAYEFDVTITNEWSPAPIGSIDITPPSTGEVIFLRSNNDPGDWESSLSGDTLHFESATPTDWLDIAQNPTVTFTLVAQLAPTQDPQVFTFGVEGTISEAKTGLIITTFTLAVESPPTISEAKTRDLDDGADGPSNGKIDAFEVTFDKNIDDTTVEPEKWFMDGVAAVDFYTGELGNDATIILQFDEADFTPAFNTDDVLQLKYDPGADGTLAGVHGTKVDAVSESANIESDGAAPALLSAVTEDTPGGDGVLDSILLTFSEDFVGTLDKADFTVDGTEPSSVTTVGTAAIRLSLDGSHNTGDTPTVSYIGDLADADGNLIRDNGESNSIAWTPDDAALPVATTIATGDADGNGQIDQVTITFSESLYETDSTVDAGDFTVGSYTISSTGASVSGAEVTLPLEEQGYDTGATPTVTLAAAPASNLEDAAGNAWAGSLPSTTTDGAAPVLIHAFIFTGKDELKAVFSEGVYTDYTGGVASGALTDGDFEYTDNGASSIDQTLTGASHTAGDDTVVLTVDNNFAESDEDEEDTLKAKTATSVYDAAGNAAPSATLKVTKKALSIVSAETKDTDSDGYLDAIDVGFNLPIDPENAEAADWTLSDGYTVDSFTVGTMKIRLLLDKNPTPDTGEIPTVTYTAASGAKSDPIGDSVGDVTLDDVTDEETTDGAPVVYDNTKPGLGAITVDDDNNGVLDSLDFVFSEPVANFNAAEWTLEWNNQPLEVTPTMADTDDRISFEFTLEDDLGTDVRPEVQYTLSAGGTRLAAEGDPADEVEDFTSPRTALDTAKPVLVSITGNPGSTLLTLTFSEPVKPAAHLGRTALIPNDFVYTDNRADGATGLSNLATTANPKVMTVTLNAPLAFDDIDPSGTGDVDTLRFKAGRVVDDAGLAAVTTPVDLTDVDGPAVVSATTVDDGNGRIDRVDVLFNEDLDPTVSLDATEFSVDGYTFAGSGSEIDGNTVKLVLNEGTEADTGATPTVTYTPGTIADLSGNVAQSYGAAALDGAAPVAVLATSVDADGSGHLDGYLVTFSEDVDVTDFLDGWTVEDRSGAQVVTAVGDEAVLVGFTPGATPDTADLPDLTYTATATPIQDDDDNEVETFTLTDDGSLVDGAAPVLVRVEGQAGDQVVKAVFSESVDNGANGNLVKEAFAYDDGPASGSATAIDSVDHTAPSDTADLTLDKPLNTVDLTNQDAVRAIPNLVVDANDNLATGNSKVFNDLIAPDIDEVRTVDSNGNGKVDRVEVVFDESLDDSVVLDAGDFTVGDDPIYGDYPIETVGIFGTILRLDLTEGDVLDTDATPTVTFDPDADPSIVKDGNANAWTGSGLPAVAEDAAKPVIVSAFGTAGSPFIDVLFSEPVYGDEEATTALDDAAVFTTDLSLTAIEQLDEALVRLFADDDLSFSTAAQVAASTTIFDAHGVEASTVAVTVTEYANGPTFDSAVTVDNDGDGMLDAVLVIFDEAVSSDLGDLDAAAWSVVDTKNTVDVSDDVVYQVSGATADGETVVVSLVENGADTADTPTVAYVRPNHGALVDADGVPLASFDDTADDGAAPVLIQAVGSPGSDRVTLHFSEAVVGSGAGGVLAITDLTYEDENGDSLIEGFHPDFADSDDASDATAEVILFGPLAFEDIGVHMVGVTAGLKDGASPPNVGLARAVPLEDDRAPTIETVETVDGDRDGWIDALRVTLSEPFQSSASTLPSDGFTVSYGTTDFAGVDLEARTVGTAANGVTYAAAGANAFYLAFAEAGDKPEGDTAFRPGLSYVGADVTDPIEDLSGNPLEDYSAATVSDGAAPAILSAETEDALADGAIESYLVTFSEDLDATGAAADWSVAGFDALALETTVSTFQLRILFDLTTLGAEGVDLGTGEMPQLTFIAPEAGVADAAGNALADLVDGDVDEEDGAAPVILQVAAQPGSDEVMVHFSEGVHNGAGAKLTQSRFVYDDGASADGATDLSPDTPNVQHTAGFATATLTLDADVNSDDIGEDTVRVVNVFDAANNPADGTAKALEDGTGPSVVSVATADTDAPPNGRIDQIVIDFDEEVEFANIDVGDFQVLTYTIDSVDTASTFGTRLTLHLKEELTRPLDTGATPTVVYDPADGGTNTAALTDRQDNAWNGVLPATEDGAPPIALHAQLVHDASLVWVTFSEDVFADEDASEPLGMEHFTYGRGADDAGLGGDDNKQVDAVYHDTVGLHVAEIQLDQPLDSDDQTAGDADQDTVTPGVIYDEGGNPLVPATLGVVGGPFVESITTLDAGDDPSSVDLIRVKLSKDIDDGTLDVTDWLSTGESFIDVRTGLAADPEGFEEDDDTFYLVPTASDMDTGATPRITYTAESGGVEDLAGNALPSFSGMEAWDGVRPYIVGVETAEFSQEADGQLDYLRVTFSEPMEMFGFDAADWSLSEGEVVSIFPEDFHPGFPSSTFLLFLDEGLDTGALPLVTYTEGDSVDAAGNPLLAETDFPSTDGATPLLLTATAPSLDSTQVTLTFSESVLGTDPDVSGKVAAADLVHSGASPVTVVSHVGSTVVVELTDGFSDGDTIRVVEDAVLDAATLAVPADAVPITTDLTAPAAIDDVEVDSFTANSATLSFTAVADDGTLESSGPADHYLVWHHTSAVTGSNWDAAEAVRLDATPGTPGSDQTVVVTGLTPDGTHHIALRAVDEAGNVGDVSNSVQVETPADSTPPTGTLALASQTHTSGQASSATTAVLSWSGISDGESAITYRYKVSDQATYTVAASDDEVTGNSLTVSGLTDGVKYVHLAGFSAGGSKQASAFKLVIDTVAPAKVDDLAASETGPLSVTLSWTAPGDDASTGTATDYQLYRSDSAFTAAGLDDVTLVSGVVAPAAAGTAQSFEVTGLTPQTAYHFAIRARDDAGSPGALSSVISVTTDADQTAPTGDLDLRSASHEDGAKSSLRDLVFAWDAATDPESAVVYRYALVEDDDYELSNADETTTETDVGFDGVEPGTWTFLVAAESAGGRATAEAFQVILLGLSDEDVEDANTEVTVKVTRKGDANVVSWVLPDDTPADVEGVQVLRSNSPYRVVATLPAGSDDFEDGTFVDDTEGATADSRYLVTMYYGESASLGKQPEGQDLDLSEPLTDVSVAPTPEGGLFGHVAFYLGLVAMLAVVGFAIAAVVVHGRQRPGPARGHEHDDHEHASWEATA